MYKNKSIGVVVPCYNESKLIARVLETMPDYVDKIIVVDDHSKDATVEVVNSYRQKLGERLIVLQHKKRNRGVGAAIVCGYKFARKIKLDITAVMAGDAQMDPSDLPKLLDPIVCGKADYTKGNRLFGGRAWEKIPHVRYLGNSGLSLLTKIVSGYWHVADSQTGYTAVTLNVLQTIRLNHMYKRYGFPNDMLVRLNVDNFRVKDVPIKPVYNIGEQSGIRLHVVIPRISWLLIRLFFWRMKEKYIIRDFHPLVFFYMLGILLLPLGGLIGFYLLLIRIFHGPVSATSVMFMCFLLISGFQSLIFGMWFDMEYNKDLKA